MNDPGTPSVDWPTVLARAHRRVALRLVLVGAIGAIGAVLLFGGGVATRAAIQQDEPSGNDSSGTSQPNLSVKLERSEGTEEGEPEAPHLTWTVTNDSGVDAGSFSILVKTTLDGELPPVQLDEGLAAGQPKRESFPCAPGDTATVVVDAENEVEESREDDNERSITCGSESLPNLVITELTDTEVEVQNLGEGIAESSTLTVTFSPAGKPVTLSVDELAPGRGWREVFTCSGESATATVDPEAVIEESKEEDNTSPGVSCETLEPPDETDEEREERETEEQHEGEKEADDLNGTGEEGSD